MVILNIKDLQANDNNRWDHYVKQHPEASLYHLTQWQDVITTSFSHACQYLFAEDDQGQIIGILPLVHIRSWLFGNNLYSMPFFNYGAALADNDQIKKKLIEAAIARCQKLGVGYLQLRESKLIAELPLSYSDNKVNMLLSLPESAEALGKSIGSKRRSQIKRPIREGVSHQFGGAELLDDFYQVFATNMRDLGTPVYAKSFFKAILSTFAEQAKICVVYWQNQPVATGFLLHFNGQMEIPWASTMRHANRISVNMYLYWQILSYAIEQGFKTFDFGRSSVDAGTYKFKKQWGAEPQPCYWYHWVPEGKPLPNLSPTNSKFDKAIKVWQKLPLAVTKIIGPPIVKNLP